MSVKLGTEQELASILSKVALPGNAEKVMNFFNKRKQAAETAGIDVAGMASKVSERMKNVFKGKSSASAQELATDRVYTIDQEVRAHTWASSFFEMAELEDDELPVIVHDGPDSNKYNVKYLGENNGAIQKQWFPTRSHNLYYMKQISTEEIEYKYRSLQVGDVREYERVNNRARYELVLKEDQECKALLDASKKASGLRSTLNLHSSIVAANFPVKNYWDLSSADAGTLTLDKLKTIVKYFLPFTGDTQEDGTPLVIRNMFISPQNIPDIWDFVSLVSAVSGTGENDPKNTIPDQERLAIYQNGSLRNAFGQPVNLIPRNTLAKGEIYVSTNKPAGYYWSKPNMADYILDNTPAMHKKNKESLTMSEVIQMAIPDEWIHHFMIVQL